MVRELLGRENAVGDVTIVARLHQRGANPTRDARSAVDAFIRCARDNTVPSILRAAVTPFFIDLVNRTDEARRRFETNPRVLAIVANGLSVERYRALLLELYHLVWHFNPTCAAAASRVDAEHAQVRYFLYEHMMEEKGHEQWVMDDLEVVGVRRQDVLRYQPTSAMLAINGFNYWSADRRHPCSVLGMVYALEVIASVYGGPIAAAIKESLLLEGDRGISFISSHVTMDAEHMAELRLLMNQIDDGASQEAIIESTIFNFDNFTRVLEAI